MMGRITAVWGLALLAEAALRVVVSLLVTPGALVAVSPLLMAAVIAPAVLWTRGRVRHARTLEER